MAEPITVAGLTARDPHEEAYITGERGKLPDDHIAENIRQYRAINSSNRRADESTDEPAASVPQKDVPAGTPYPFEEFLTDAKPLNPDATDQELASYWADHYKSSTPTPKDLPTLDTWLKDAKPQNPDASEQELKAYWDTHYGIQGAGETPPGFLSHLARGAQVGMEQLLPTMKGAVGLVGATAEEAVGAGGAATAVKNWGLSGFKEGMEKIAPLQQPNDEFDQVWKKVTEQGDLGALKNFVAYGLGYGASQIAQAAVVGVGGAIVGSMVGGPAGTIPGAVAGVVEQTAAKGLIASWVEKAVLKRVATGMTRDAAVRSIGRDIGALTAMGAFASSQEAGQIYPEAEAQPGELDPMDLARVWGASALAGSTELIPEAYIFGKALGRLTGGPSRIGRTLSAGATGMALEGGQEAVQTGIEHYGAGTPIADDAGLKDIINSAALAMVGGGSAGATAGFISPSPQTGPIDRDKQIRDILNDPTVDGAITKAQEAVDTPAFTTDHLDAFIKNQQADGQDHLDQVAAEGDLATQSAIVKGERDADQQALVKVFGAYRPDQETDHPLTTDERGQSFFQGHPLEAVHPSQLPDTTPPDGGLSREKYEVLNAVAQTLGKRVVIFGAQPTLPDGLVHTEDPSTIYLSSKTQDSDLFSVLTHEAIHLTQGTAFHEALRDVVWATKTPEAKQLAIDRHGNLPHDQLLNEMVSDISGTELHKPEVWEKVFRSLQERTNDEKAKTEMVGFIDTLKSMLAKVKELIATAPWATGFGNAKKTLAEQYVKDLTLVHDALAEGVANVIYETRAGKSTQSEKGKLALSKQSGGSRSIVHPEAVAAFTALATEQRGSPETAMLNVQKAGVGVMNPVVEHVGDLIHRMTEGSHAGLSNKDVVTQKLDQSITMLIHAYGFEQEHHENLRHHARARHLPVDQIRSTVDAALLAYANEHRKLPVYNQLHWLAREASVAVGEQRFEEAVRHLKDLKKLVSSGEYDKEVFRHEPGYLRPIEAKLIGIQRGIANIPDFELYNLESDIPGHPAGSTVSRETIEEAGYKPVASDLISRDEAVEHRKSLKETGKTGEVVKDEGKVVKPSAEKKETTSAEPAEKQPSDVLFSPKQPPIGIAPDALPDNAKAPKVQWDKTQAQENLPGTPEDWKDSGWGKGTPTIYQSFLSNDEVPRVRSTPDAGNYDYSQFKKTGVYPPMTVVLHENGVASKLEDGHHRMTFWRMKGFDHFPAWIVDFRKPAVQPARVLFSPKIWFSTLGNTLNEKMPNKASKEQVQNLLKSPGVKEDEVKWTGIQDYLDAQPGVIDKHNLLEWLKQNDVRVNEVRKRSGEAGGQDLMPIHEFVQNWHRDVEQMRTHDREDVWTNRDFPHAMIRNTDDTSYWHVQIGEKFLESDGTLADEYSSTNAFNSLNAATEAAYEHLVVQPRLQEMQEGDSRGNTQYEGYKLPGGTDYTELLLTLDTDRERSTREMMAKQKDGALSEEEYQQWRTSTLKPKTTEDFTSPHFDEPNILAHVRFDTRKDADGKSVLFLEEVQSDWHEQGREKGYADPNKKRWVVYAFGNATPVGRFSTSEEAYQYASSHDIGRGHVSELPPDSGVPDAPFKTTWPELVMKRMLRWASEHNYDRLAWTTGAQQNDRYGLAKTGVEISYFWNDTLTVNVRINDQHGRAVYTNNNATSEELNGVIGRELTQKMVQGQGRPQQESYGRESLDVKVLSGLDLEVGGSGMKYFYDQMLPRFMEKYLKRFGTKVDKVKLNTELHHDIGTGETEQHYAYVHSISLTPEMKDSVINKGQPLFSPKKKVTLPPPYPIEQPGALDKFIRLMQDKTIDIKRIVEDIKKAGHQVHEDVNPVLREEMYQKRAEQRSKDFTVDELRPLLDMMRLNKVTIPQLDDYLHARHVIDDNLNARLQQINPDLVGTPAYDKLSGITDAEAQAILARSPAIMGPLANRVDQIVNKTRDLMVDYGLEKQSRIDEWRQQYSAYVPLRREGFDEKGYPTGQGYSVRGSTVNQRSGSGLAVENILANIAQARDQIITRGEKQKPVVAFAALMMLYPNKDLATLDKPAQITMTNPASGLPVTVPGNLTNYQVPTVRRFDKVTGTMKSYPDPTYKGRDNVVNFRVKGIDYAIVFNEKNVRAMEAAKAFKNIDTNQLSGIMQAVAPYTRYLAAINTQYNPIFGIVNFIRDSQYAMLTLGTTPIAGKKLTVLNNARKALAGIYQDARNIRKGIHPSSGTALDWEEFQEVGGPTGYRDLFFTASDRAKEIERMLNPKTWKNVTSPAALGRRMEETPLFKWLSDYNTTMENSIRLGVYITARDMGIGKLQAASYAKNITVNFNKKGQIGAQMGALYAFFNANVQGTARIAETLFEKTPSGFKISALGGKIITGGILVGILQTFALTMAGMDDDDPPEFVKQKNLIFPVFNKGKDYGMLPMPLGFNLLPNIGRLAAESVKNFIMGKPPRLMDKAASLFGSMFNALSPTGGSGGILQELAPTVADPLVALGTNTDWTGRSIAKEDHSSLKPTPGHTRAHDTATVWAKGLSYAINWATGGDKYEPGKLSPTPDSIDYVIQQATGGVGREVSKIAQGISSLATGETLPTHKIPLAGRFVGSATGQSAIRTRFYENVRKANIAYEGFEGRAKDHVAFDTYLQTHPEARYAKSAVIVEKEVGVLQKQKQQMIKDGANRTTIKLQEERISSLMSRFNELIEASAQ